jgi:hypothetical protein
MRQYDPPGGLRGDVGPPSDEEETGEIRVEIEQTRTELSGTIDAIQQKLSPDVLTEQAKDVARDVTEQAKDAAQKVLEQAVQEVKSAALEVTEHAVQEVKEAAREVTGQAKDAAWDATVGKAEHAVEATVESVEDAVSSAGQAAKGVGSMVIDTIKQNPVPAALAGLALGWLFMNRSSGQTTSSYYRGEASYRAYPPLPQYDDRPTAYAREEQGAVGKIADKVGGAASQVGETASDVASSAGEMVSDAASTAGRVVGDVASSAGQVTSSAGEMAIDTGSDLLELIKRNPVPAALTGLGLAWLYMNRSAGRQPYQARSESHQWQGSYGRSGYQPQPSYGRAGYQPGTAYGRTQAAYQPGGSYQPGAGYSGTESRTRQSLGSAGRPMSERRSSAGGIQGMVEDNPLMAAALAATVGGAVGLTLPATRTEDQLLGKTRDSLMGKAEQVTQDTIEKVQSVAGEAQNAAKKEAQVRGLTT